MSKTITIVTGSARPNSLGTKTILPLVKAELEKNKDVTVRVADLKELDMPFVDSEVIPAAEGYAPPHDSVKKWQEIVQASDGFVFLVPQYNNQISAIQKNAVDWLYDDWKDKVVSFVGYSWGGSEAVIEMMDKLMVKVGAKPLPTSAKLFFKKDIDLDGTLLDEKLVEQKIADTVKELLSGV